MYTDMFMLAFLVAASSLTVGLTGETTTTSTCYDTLDTCNTLYCVGSYAFLSCRKHCNLCNGPPSTPSPVPTITTTANVKTSTASACQDKLDWCYSLDKTFYCVGPYADWALLNCRKTCNLCHGPLPTPSQVPTVTSTTSTKGPMTTTEALCYYKGAQYDQDESWHDGCQYLCHCEEASIGYYKCVDNCYQWGPLPAGCSLSLKPGLCCPQPTCHSGANLTVPSGYAVMYPGVPVDHSTNYPVGK